MHKGGGRQEAGPQLQSVMHGKLEGYMEGKNSEKNKQQNWLLGMVQKCENLAPQNGIPWSFKS